MKKIVFPPRGYIILGLAFFVVGLLIILQESRLFGLVSQIVPNNQSALIFGAVIQSIGQAIVMFGIVKANSLKLVSSLQVERQITTTAFAKNLEQLQARMQNERQSLIASYNQTMLKIDHLIARLPINCKYCGTKVEQGAFCSECGKAN